MVSASYRMQEVCIHPLQCRAYLRSVCVGNERMPHNWLGCAVLDLMGQADRALRARACCEEPLLCVSMTHILVPQDV
jgi:hypothetical protein